MEKVNQPTVIRIDNIKTLIKLLKSNFGENLYGKPTDIIGFNKTGKELANALEPLIGNKEICFYDSDIKSDDKFHYLDFENMLKKTELMFIMDEKYLNLIKSAKTKINPNAKIFLYS